MAYVFIDEMSPFFEKDFDKLWTKLGTTVEGGSVFIKSDFHLGADMAKKFKDIPKKYNEVQKETAIEKSENRAVAVLNEIEVIKKNVVENVFRLGELLSEIRNSAIYQYWGFDNFGKWVEKSGLDMSERQAFYLIRIIENAKTLGIDSNNLKKVKLSKLKEIFTLDPAKDAKEIEFLIEKGKTESLDAIREQVQAIQNGPGEDTYTYLNLKISKKAKQEIIDPAIEIARREYGSTVNLETGDPVDISLGRAIELICADYKADPNHQEQPVIDVEVQIPVEGE